MFSTFSCGMDDLTRKGEIIYLTDRDKGWSTYGDICLTVSQELLSAPQNCYQIFATTDSLGWTTLKIGVQTSMSLNVSVHGHSEDIQTGFTEILFLHVLLYISIS